MTVIIGSTRIVFPVTLKVLDRVPIAYQSIFNRKKPLAQATIRRIANGITRYAPAGERGDLEQFLIKYYGQGTARPLKRFS